MQKLIALGVTLLLCANASAQAIYGPTGRYEGYATVNNGVMTVYDTTGQQTKVYQSNDDQTDSYTPQGRYTGTSTTPFTAPTNTRIGSPREVRQVRSIGGW